MCQLWQIKENIKYNPFDDISISFNPLYVKENSHNKFTSFHWLICNAEWKFFNSFWLLKQNTFSQSCANSVTKSKRTLLKNGWSTPVECLNSLRTWQSRGHFKSQCKSFLWKRRPKTGKPDNPEPKRTFGRSVISSLRFQSLQRGLRLSEKIEIPHSDQLRTEAFSNFPEILHQNTENTDQSKIP